MGFCVSQNIIYDEDVEIKKSKADFFVSNIKSYIEGDNFKVIKPTLDLYYLLRGKINFTTPLTQAAVIRKDRLEILSIFPNLYHYQTFQEVVDHFNDDRKEYYLVKVTKSSIYSLYVVERSKISDSRQHKLEQLLAE